MGTESGETKSKQKNDGSSQKSRSKTEDREKREENSDMVFCSSFLGRQLHSQQLKG